MASLNGVELGDPAIGTVLVTVNMLTARAAPEKGPALQGNADEIRVKVSIHSVGLRPPFTPDSFTDEEVLP